jgi:hypothetical protein
MEMKKVLASLTIVSVLALSAMNLSYGQDEIDGGDGAVPKNMLWNGHHCYVHRLGNCASY